MTEKQKSQKFFIIARGLDLDDKDQLIQFIVPGFNMIKTVRCAIDANEEEIDGYLDKFQLEVSGEVEDWRQALASDDEKVKNSFPDQQTYDACWMVNQAVEDTVKEVAGEDKDNK